MTSEENNSPIVADAWSSLRKLTPARIALGRAGGSLPTHEWLKFKSAHAVAREAVHCEFNAEQLSSDIVRLNSHAELDPVIVDSQATDRATFLQRPDLGRRLSDRSRWELQELASAAEHAPDLVIVVSDGLSALAVHRQATPLLGILLPKLTNDKWTVSRIVIARFGRVALQDEVGQVLRARLALMLLGERPGLGSPDSLGAYLVHGPRIGNTDANRNCVSNIRPDGLPLEAAAKTTYHLLTEARRRGISGVQLKDERNSTGQLASGATESAPATLA